MPRREHLIICGRHAPAPLASGRGRAWKNAKIVRLDVTPVTGNVTVRIRDITDRMVSALPPVAEDLVELASYVYAADQASTRGSLNGLDYGREWRRRFRFEVPVRRPDIWRDPRVNDQLVQTLSFLSDDDFEFGFVPLRSPTRWPDYLEFEPGGPAVNDVQEVMLFSGGLDSLAGAVEEVLVRRRKVALVSHRPVTKLDSRQSRLVQELGARAASASATPFHVPVLVNKKEYLGRDFTQRTRSFLFAAFGGIVARLFGLERLRFYENGVVSCNLPICAQVLGGRASRTTHPRVLNGLGRLLGLLFERKFVVENPYMWKTRTDVVSELRAAGHATLAAHSVSCAHTWQASTDQPHCGTCSQCIDRRLAILAAKLTEAEDPSQRYRTDLFTGDLEDVLDQTMVERVVGTAQEVERIDNPIEFLRRFGEASRLLRQLPGHPDEVAVQIFGLHRRHAQQVNGVIHAALAERHRIGRWQDLSPRCLLRVLGGDAVGDVIKSEFVPTADDRRILTALVEAKSTMGRVALEVASDVSRKTVTKRLREMSRYKLVYYPHGARKGVALTPGGRNVAQSLQPSAVG